MTATWECLGLNLEPCDASGEGTDAEVDRAARDHTKATGHGTVTHNEPRRR